MKNIIKLLAVLFFFTLSSKVYSQVDTLNYVKQFEVNKIEYINKPFSYLLSHMTQLQPQTVNSMVGIWGEDLVASSHFDYTVKEMQYGRETVYMIVYWKNPISRTQAFALSKQNKFLLTNDEKIFYGNKIVKDIKVFKN